MTEAIREKFERREFGRTGEIVSVLGFGSMELRNTPHRRPRPVSNEVACVVLNSALDLGINFIDTSIDYGDAEERIGRYIGNRRDEYLIASKAGCPIDHQPHATTSRLVHDYSPANLRAGLEQSLYRLRTDHLDLLQLHLSPSLSAIAKDDAAATLKDFHSEGKVRFLGISSELPDLADHICLDWVDAVQIPYSAVDPGVGDYLPQLASRSIAVIVRGGTAQGGFGGAVQWALLGLDDELLGGEPLPEFLLRFAISEATISTVLIGTASPEHLAAAARAAARGPLPQDVRQIVQRRVIQALKNV